jgi:hypothetical protein
MKRAALLAVLVALVAAGIASGERVQRGNLIVRLDGSFAPLTLPRDRTAPVSVHLEAGLQTADHSVLPRVTRVELGVPGQAAITTTGLPTCSLRRLRNTTTARALELCRSALIGTGRMAAQVKIPYQDPFVVDTRLLAFNARIHGQRAVIVHGVSPRPPAVVALPFLIELRRGRFGMVLVARLPPTLGPWPRFARLEINLSRHYFYRGHRFSYLSARCSIPKRVPASIVPLAKATFTLADGRRVSTEILRSCRARGGAE